MPPQGLEPPEGSDGSTPSGGLGRGEGDARLTTLLPSPSSRKEVGRSGVGLRETPTRSREG